MHSSRDRKGSDTCFHGCIPTPFLSLLAARDATSKPSSSAASYQHEFASATASTLFPNAQFTNHESLISLSESFSNFIKAYPQYSKTDQADRIRGQEYYHLSLSRHVCLDYIGHGLFSYSQQQIHHPNVFVASTSAPPTSLNSKASKQTFFEISYKSVSLHSQVLYGGQESELESKIRKRIMSFFNITEADYTMVFTTNQASAFKLLAESYPFHSNQNLLTVYDHESEAEGVMIDTSKKRGARVMSAQFSWPSLRIHSGKLMKMVASRRKRKRGLFVFPLQSRMTGARYSYLWMSIAQQNGWHVCLDACALRPRDMDTLGFSLIQPDFLICTFFRVFGDDPSGFGCLFVKKSSASVLKDSTLVTSIGIVSLNPTTGTSQFSEESAINSIKTDEQMSKFVSREDDPATASSVSGSPSALKMDNEISELYEIKEASAKQKEASSSEIVELETPFVSAQFKDKDGGVSGRPYIECRGLDHADSLGLILISSRVRYLTNWLVNALTSLRHPHSENGLPLVKIYGPKIKLDRGPAIAFNLFDWEGEKVDPSLVQKLADRNNISLSYGFLQHIWFSDKREEERERIAETRTAEVRGTVLNKKAVKLDSRISVVTASLGFLTNFEDTYRLWAFVSQFLDADFLEKERWRYTALNQKTIEV
ncbi:uncharacterized protein LOC131164192 [Malania oleifera]|uniref:uncharacterized protein LOC131164192 n=1 Tax=Malania oleifera TaxID=397392 RepID=UPI0025AE79BF|nr:uncharacterized protein LOC131164192 [Malania oleifera]